MENLNLIEGLDSSIIDVIERTDKAYRRREKVATDVMVYDPHEKILIVMVKQFKKPTDTVFTKEELFKMGEAVFSHLPEGYRIHYRARVWTGDGLEAVTAEYVRSEMKKYSLFQDDLADELGIDKHVLSKLMDGHVEFTRWQKAAFFYYFKWYSFKRG